VKPVRKKKQRRLDPAEVERRYQESEKFLRETDQKKIEEDLASDKEGAQLEAEVLQKSKEFDAKYGSSNRSRATTATFVSIERLLSLGGVKEVFVDPKDFRKVCFRIIFGGKGETRLIFTPYNGACMVAMERNKSLEELRRVLNKAGRNLWDVIRSRPDIAFTAVEELLECFEQFKALPPDEQWKVDARLAIMATLNALEQDTKAKTRKLQVAFKLRTGAKWLQPIDQLHEHTFSLSVALQRPPSKKELKEKFDQHWEGFKIQSADFAKLLKRAGLAWLRRESTKRCLG